MGADVTKRPAGSDPWQTRPPRAGGIFGTVARYGSVIFGLAAIATIWSGTLYMVNAEKMHAERAAEQMSANLARAFEEQIVRGLRSVDQTLHFLRASYVRVVAEGGAFDIHGWADNVQALTEFTFQVVIIGPDGILRASKRRQRQGRRPARPQAIVSTSAFI